MESVFVLFVYPWIPLSSLIFFIKVSKYLSGFSTCFFFFIFTYLAESVLIQAISFSALWGLSPMLEFPWSLRPSLLWAACQPHSCLGQDWQPGLLVELGVARKWDEIGLLARVPNPLEISGKWVLKPQLFCIFKPLKLRINGLNLSMEFSSLSEGSCTCSLSVKWDSATLPHLPPSVCYEGQVKQ